jgi:hypothetical protein
MDEVRARSEADDMAERLARPELWPPEQYEGVKRWVNEVVDTMAEADTAELRAALLGLREVAIHSINMYEEQRSGFDPFGY